MKKWISIIPSTILLTFLVLAVLFSAYLYHWFPAVKPTLQAQVTAEQIIREYVDNKWDGRVVVESITVEKVVYGTDFPTHEWTQYDYVVYLRVIGADIRFAGQVDQDVVKRTSVYRELDDKAPFASPLTDDDIELLSVYAALTDVPAGMWWSAGQNDQLLDDDGLFDDEEWDEEERLAFLEEMMNEAYVYSFSTQGVYGENSYYFERQPDGTYMLTNVFHNDETLPKVSPGFNTFVRLQPLACLIPLTGIILGTVFLLNREHGSNYENMKVPEDRMS